MAHEVSVIEVGPFGAQVALFESDEERLAYFREALGFEGKRHEGPHYGLATREYSPAGKVYFTITICPDANITTLAHEASHMVDWMCDEHGVPLGVENTEIRAYMLESIFADLADHFGFEFERKGGQG